MQNNNRGMPRVAIGVMIFKDGTILLGKRKGSHGAGEWAFPGGHLEYGESLEDCVRRETREECGLEITNIHFQCISNLLTHGHYVRLGFTADWLSGEPVVLEPDKCESWSWCTVEALPQPIFEPVYISMQSYKTGQVFFDSN